MTTAIANLDKSFNGKEFLKKERYVLVKVNMFQRKNSVLIKGYTKQAFLFANYFSRSHCYFSCGFFYFTIIIPR